jgi:hypothetical protein
MKVGERNMNLQESIRRILREENEGHKVKLVIRMIHSLYDEVSFIEQSTYNNKPLLIIYFDSDDTAANIESWFDKKISRDIDEMTSGKIVVCPDWVANWDSRKKNADVYINTERRVLKEDRKLSNFLKRRLKNLDYEVESRLNNTFRNNNICLFFKNEVDLFETIMEESIDSMYYNYFSHIDDNSGEWAHEYLDMVDYIRKKYQDKIMKHYDDNCGSGSIPLKESIRRVLKEELNESTYLRRRVAMSSLDEEFYENLDIVTDRFLKLPSRKQSYSFKDFKDAILGYIIEDFHYELTNNRFDDYPYGEVYEFLSNHYHDKIKDRYVEVFGGNINESETIRRILKEEYEIPLNVRRRFNILKNILGSSLRSSYPCDYDVLDEFIEDIISEVNQYFRWIDKENEMTSEQAELTIRAYLLDDIKEYYLEEIINC